MSELSSKLSYGIEIGSYKAVIRENGFSERFSRGVQDVPVANCINDVPLLNPTPFPEEQNCIGLSKV